jgi:hypothetical protein
MASTYAQFLASFFTASLKASSIHGYEYSFSASSSNSAIIGVSAPILSS